MDILPLATGMGPEGLMRVNEVRQRETASISLPAGSRAKPRPRANTQLATERGEWVPGGLAERHGCRVKGEALAQCPVLVWTQHVAAGGCPQLR